MADADTKKKFGWTGSIVSGAACSVWWAPAIAPGLGASIFGGLGSLALYRPYFIAFSILMLGWTFYRHFKNRIHQARSDGLGAVIAMFRPNTAKDTRLYLGAALVIALIMFPYWGRPLLARNNDSGPDSRPAATRNFYPGKNPCFASKNPCAKPKNPCARK